MWEKQHYLDDTQNALISVRVCFNFVVLPLISFNDSVFGTPTRRIWCILVLYRNSQNICLDG